MAAEDQSNCRQPSMTTSGLVSPTGFAFIRSHAARTWAVGVLNEGVGPVTKVQPPSEAIRGAIKSTAILTNGSGVRRRRLGRSGVPHRFRPVVVRIPFMWDYGRLVCRVQRMGSATEQGRGRYNPCRSVVIEGTPCEMC